MTEPKASDRRGRVTLINLPLEIFEALPDPALAMHVYTRVVALSRHDEIRFTKGSREITLGRSECVFYARKFSSRWGYDRRRVTRAVKGLEQLGFWTITESRDGFTIRVRPLQKVPGFAAAQVFEANRVTSALMIEAKRDILLEQARALAREDRGLYQGLFPELQAISMACNTGNARGAPGSAPVNGEYKYPNSRARTTRSEKGPAGAGQPPGLPALGAREARQEAREAPPALKGGPAGLPSAQGAPGAKGGASGAAGWVGRIEGAFADPIERIRARSAWREEAHAE